MEKALTDKTLAVLQVITANHSAMANAVVVTKKKNGKLCSFKIYP
jgi:hypothetical protein